MFSCIMLAAGESSRMGRLKALLPWGQSTLLEAQIEQVAQAQIGELIIVIGFGRDQLEPKLIEMQNRFKDDLNTKIIVNNEYYSGKTSSIRAGMTGISNESKGVVILGVDQPVQSQTLDQLFSGLQENSIRIPRFEGIKGHPPVFSCSYYRELANVSEKNEGLRQITHKYPNHIEFIEVKQPQVLLNLNTEQDYIHAKEKSLDRYHQTDLF